MRRPFRAPASTRCMFYGRPAVGTSIMKSSKSILRSVHARMVLVICTAAVPTLIGLFFYVYQQRMDYERLEQESAQNYVDLASRYQNWLIASSSETLRAMTAVPIIRRAE